jgi:hypothetical protein
MPTPILISLLIVAAPLLAWTGGFLHALVRRRLPGGFDRAATAAAGVSLALSTWLLVREVLLGGGIGQAWQWTSKSSWTTSPSSCSSW